MGSQRLVTLKLVTAVTFILLHTVVLTASQFMVQPVSVVQAQGVDAVFECQYLGAQNHNWGLNGEFPTENNYPPDVTVTPSSGDTPATLTIPATAQYNNTVVQCEVVVRDRRGFISELSVNASLQVQEPLPAVADLTVNNIAGNCSQLNVTWVAPFSLNLTTAEPDIQYCVDVYDITSEREKNMLQSECNITTTQYLFDIAYHVGTYSFSVTPRSNIDGSLNGTISKGQFSYEPQAIPIDEVDFTTNTELNPLRVAFPSSLIRECRVPDKYSVQIQYIDREVSDPCNCSTDQSTGNTQMIVLDLDCSSCNIERHRRCNLTLLAESNLRNTPSVMMTMNISTHDVYKVTDFSMKEKEISITVDYIRQTQSNDRGYVAIVYSVDSSSSDVHYQVVYQENTSPTVFGNLTDHVYKLAVFDLNDVMKPERKLVFPAVLPNTSLDNGTTEASAGGQVAVPNYPGGEDMNATEVNGTICISCSSSCVGIIHSQYGLDQGNITLIPRTVTDSGQKCTESMPQGMYFAAIFSDINKMLSYKTVIHIDLSTSTTASDTHTDALTPVTNFVDNSTTVIVGGIAAAAATTVVIIAFLVVIAFVWRRNRREKRTTLVIEMQNTSLLENDYGPPLSLNREYSVPSEAAGGPPPIPTYQYENVEQMSLTRATEPPVSIDEPPPSYYAAATDRTRHNVSTLERNNHDTAPNHSANNRVTQAMGASENERCVYLHMEPGTSSMPHDQSVELAPKDPVYDVAKKDFANSTPTQNNNKTETPVVYAALDVNLKANSTPPMQHPVVYALIDGSSLAPRSIENNTPCILPSLSPPPTAESVLAEIYPVAKRWEALGEALGIKEHHLDSFSTEGHEQVCLHDMILYYFNFSPHSWEDIVKALWEIGETEAADKIIRSGKCTVELPVTSPAETPPPLPPRNDTAKAASHQTEAGELSHDDWQDHSVQESNTETESTEEHQGSVLSAGDQVIAIRESDEYNSKAEFPQPTGLGNKPEDGPTGRKNNSSASTLSGSISEMPCFSTVCNPVTCMDDPIPDKEEPNYRTTMIQFLGVIKKLDVIRNHHGSALGYLNSGQSALSKDLYQQRMSAVDEVHENNISHVVPEKDDTTIENYDYTEEQSVGEIALFKRESAKLVFDVSMNVLINIFNMLVFRLTATGMTNLLHLLTDNVPPLQRDGTPCMEKPVLIRPLSNMKFKSTGRGWEDVSQPKLSTPLPQVIAKLSADHLVRKSTNQSITSRIVKSLKKITTLEPISSFNEPISGSKSSQLSVDSDALSGSAKLLDKAIDENDVAEALKPATQGTDQLLSRDQQEGGSNWVYVTDCSGQPQQFHVISPLFIKHILVMLVVLRLIDNSDEYYMDGKLVGSPHTSHMTLRETLQSLIRSIESHTSQDKKSKVILVGTFLDQLKTLNKRSKEILDMLPPDIKKLLVCEHLGLIFGLNTISRDDDSLATANGIISAVECFMPLQVRMPLWWSFLDSFLQSLYASLEFEIPKLSCTVTLIDSFSYIKVYIDVQKEVYPMFRKEVLNNIELSCTVLHYNSDTAIVCPCKKSTISIRTLHLADVIERNDCKFWKCSLQARVWRELGSEYSDGDICHLEAISCSGELEVARQVQRLPFEYLMTIDVNECLLSQWLHNTVRWLTNNTFSRCLLVQQMVTRLLYFDQTWPSVLNFIR